MKPQTLLFVSLFFYVLTKVVNIYFLVIQYKYENKDVFVTN